MTECVLCDVKEFSILYEGLIRKGVFGSETNESHKVVIKRILYIGNELLKSLYLLN